MSEDAPDIAAIHRVRPVTREDAAAIVNWVNEGGATHPSGPPSIIGDEERLERGGASEPAENPGQSAS
jgi:hypothetical protein